VPCGNSATMSDSQFRTYYLKRRMTTRLISASKIQSKTYIFRRRRTVV